MTGQAIIDFFESLVDDSLDETLELTLLNNAKDKVEGERDWEFLKKLDSSQTATTAGISLPSDHSRTLDVFVNTSKYLQIPFEQQKQFANASARYYLDMANSKLYLIGIGTGGTVHHFYIYQTPDITLSTSPVWPDRFHKLIGYEMAEQFFAIDGGDRARSWDDKFGTQRELLRRSMVDWDAALKRRAIENAAADDTDCDIDLAMM